MNLVDFIEKINFPFVYKIYTMEKEKERVRSDRENLDFCQVAVHTDRYIKFIENFLTCCAELVELVSTRIYSRTPQTIQILPHFRKTGTFRTHARTELPTFT